MLSASDLRVIRFTPIEPDVIASEIWIGDERIVAELIWGFDGSKMLHLTEGAGVDLDATAFARLVSQEMSHLEQSAKVLREPGGAWDPQNSYYQEGTSEAE